MKSTQNLLSVKGLQKYFPLKGKLFQKRPYLKAVENVSFDIKKGEVFALVGESGCGKSTLGRTILQLYRPTKGQVLYYGEGGEMDLCKLSKPKLRKMRKEIQIVFQDPYSSLNPRLTVGQTVEEGMLAHGLCKKGAEVRKKTAEIFEKCGLPSDCSVRYPHQFSGGQRQRVCIARALALNPKFIVCDECVSALDASVQSQILNLLSDLKEKEGLTYLFISHDLSVVRYISDRVAVMYLGEIVELGQTEEIFKNPRHPYTVALLSASPKITGKKSEKIYLSGHTPSPVTPPCGCKFHTRCFMAQDICRRQPPPLTEIKEGHTVACHFAEITASKKREIALSQSEQGEKSVKNG